MIEKKIQIEFDSGTLVLTGTKKQLSPAINYITFDERINAFRAEAQAYPQIILALHHAGIEYKDDARKYSELSLHFNPQFNPRNYQTEALTDWEKTGRGVIVMPTGSGKSFLANMIISEIRRSTLIVVPTIDLMQQWATTIERDFNIHTGMIGGGENDLQDITVTTYDSAAMRMDFMGNRFGLIIFDECHHLPGEIYKTAAEMCIAPFRLGLTATLERTDGGEQLICKLIGDVAHRIEIDELEGNTLAPYQTKTFPISLTQEEKLEYDSTRKIYTDFLRQNSIDFRTHNWGYFIAMCCRRQGGRDALKAYMKQKQIARNCKSKFDAVWKLLKKYAGRKIIIFTADNDTAYRMGKEFLLPVLTHHTKARERKEMLDMFRSNEYTVLMTSNVLNEGIDVPEASVGIIVSGTGSIREHVQRLGRILRPAKGKQAVLYELVSSDTSEEYISKRRREHRAYQKSY
ncbi:MAG: DEAD/DEAH box helicase family protein [Verrucomicrobiota bacterium]|nr:DEAD/DEAH box helicase family protein [Verrucomicrobiota bacterium]